MIELYEKGAYLINGTHLVREDDNSEKMIENKFGKRINKEEDKKGTIAYSILKEHNKSDNMQNLKIKFDKMTSHDITYVGIIQTARASGLKEFPISYTLTNCHNSLCAVGGTINEDDHLFGLSGAKKYGGNYVPAHVAVIHQYMREMESACGKMILGSDSHTRYGALGTMAIGEGGPELVKQLLGRTYDVPAPKVVCVYLTGKVNKGVGPQDVALAIIGAVFKNGYVKNKVMEFVGDGIDGLSVDFRNGIDVMTTETTCLSSIWRTDNKVKDYYRLHFRENDYKELSPSDVAYYDGAIVVDLSKVKPMIAMPFHPSNTYTIDELNENLEDILAQVEKVAVAQLDAPNIDYNLRSKIKNGGLYVEQGVIAGCAGGTFENICDSVDILEGKFIGADEFALSVYPSSQPVYYALAQNGGIGKLLTSGATVRTAFCGPCFGAGDVPANNCLSVRHSTRNFPNREGSKPSGGQIASVALMDARSIAATAANKGRLTPATDFDGTFKGEKYFFNKDIYENRCYYGYGNPQPQEELRFAPNIVEWPKMGALADDMLLKVVSYIEDEVTTTDELIPSGETSSYRSNPLKLAEFTLSRKDPAYVPKAKEIQNVEFARLEGKKPQKVNYEMQKVFDIIKGIEGFEDIRSEDTQIGSAIFAIKPGDGSAREQAASCQKVLGTLANVAREYATKRYRSNLINWGMLPFVIEGEIPFSKDCYLFIPNIKMAVKEKWSKIKCFAIGNAVVEFELTLGDLTDDERKIILAGCLMNYYKEGN